MATTPEDWTCPSCTAINPHASRYCWNCESQRQPGAHDEAPEHSPPSETTSSLRDLLLPYTGKLIDVNASQPTEFERAVLAAVHGEYFTVLTQSSRQTFHFPYRHILSASESDGQHGNRLTIEVFRQVFVKGSIGFGFSTPL